ncbi:MAG: PAS domain S-box protein, partial [bacterium]
MKNLLRFADWPLRAKMVALLFVASLLPLGIAAFGDVRSAESNVVSNSSELLKARGDQLAERLDAFNQEYMKATVRLSKLNRVVEYCRASPEARSGLQEGMKPLFLAHTDNDPNMRGLAILDMNGKVLAASADYVVGWDLSSIGHVKAALKSRTSLSDVFMDGIGGDHPPMVAFYSQVLGVDGKPVGVAGVWVKAQALWDLMRASKELAGKGSYAVLLDSLGIRIGHSSADNLLFRPTGPVDPVTIARLEREGRFGSQTRKLLTDVRSFPLQFERAKAATPSTASFKGFSPTNSSQNFGVARRLKTVPWTLFYMVPEASVEALVVDVVRQKILLAMLIIALAFAAGIGMAMVIARPIHSLASATDALAEGDLAVRVKPTGHDEIGQLGSRFNLMAQRLEDSTAALRAEREGLEARVIERTQELRASEARTHSIVETALDAVVTIDRFGLVNDWNPQAESTFGWTRKEAVGRELVALVIPERFREAHRKGLERYLRTGEATILGRRIELCGLHKDGHEFPVELAVTPIGSGDNIGFSAFLRDITARKQSEEAIRASKEQYEALAESIPHLIWTCQGNGNGDFLSKQWESYTGRSNKDVVGYVTERVIHPDDRPRVDAEWERAIENGTDFKEEFRLLRRDGEYRWFSGRAVPLKDSSGKVIKWFGSNTDIHDDKISQQRLRTQLERMSLLGDITSA